MGKAITAGLVALGLKAGQQILHDLDKIILNESTADGIRYMTETYACRYGCLPLVAYAFDKTISNFEEALLPRAKVAKVTKGLTTMALATFGTAAAIHYGGSYTDLTPGTSYIETLTQLLVNCKETLANIVTLNPEKIRDGYLLTSLIFGIGAGRWIKNMTQVAGEKSEERKLEAKIERQERLQDLEQSLNGMLNKKRGTVSKKTA